MAKKTKKKKVKHNQDGYALMFALLGKQLHQDFVSAHNIW